MENAKSDEDREKIKKGYEMLIEPTKMGDRFKFMAFYPSSMAEMLNKYPPLGFSTPKSQIESIKFNDFAFIGFFLSCSKISVDVFIII